MEEREAILRRWFSMWLEGKDQGIAALFQEDALYIESWGPQYQGVEKIKHWFTEWNTRGRVLRWDMGACFHRGAGDHGDLAVSLPDGRRDRAGF